MNNKTKIAIVFWMHFCVAIGAHLSGVAIVGGLISLVTTTALTFWLKALLVGIVFFMCMYCTNHLTNSQGFCVLTDIENLYRRREGIEEVGPFTPRFYRHVGKIFKNISNFFKRK